MRLQKFNMELHSRCFYPAPAKLNARPSDVMWVGRAGCRMTGEMQKSCVPKVTVARTMLTVNCYVDRI